MIKSTRKYITAFIVAFVMLALAASPAPAVLTIKANHDDIKINYNYHGSTVSVTGISDPGVDLVIKIASPDGVQKLMRKAKVGGFLWMKVGELAFDNMPSLYLMKSTKKPQDILSNAQIAEHAIGYEALEQGSSIEAHKGGEVEPHKWFGQFFKYMENRQVYNVQDGGIELSQKDGQQNYSSVFPWPYQARPGKYSVSVFSVKDGSVVESASAEVSVEQVGSVKMLYNMAKNNGGMYGVVAIIIALAAGFGVGLVFGKGGGAH